MLDAALEQMASSEASTAMVSGSPYEGRDLPSASPDPESKPVLSLPPTPSSTAGDAAVPPDSGAVPDLALLNDPDIFAKTALEHIFVGSVNARGAASGYHSEAYPFARGEVIEGSRTELDENGVYEGQVRVDGKDKSGNRGYSSFFPTNMTVLEVVTAIREAYETRVLANGNTWRGEGGELSILMVLDENDHIISAFPEYGG